MFSHIHVNLFPKFDQDFCQFWIKKYMNISDIYCILWIICDGVFLPETANGY